MRKLFLFYLFLVVNIPSSFAQKEIMYVGTFSKNDSKGIYVLEFDRAKGTLKKIQTASGLESPNFLDVHPGGKYLYSVNRQSVDNVESNGSASAWAIEKKTGKLTLLNHQSSKGADPAHISIDKTGKLAFVSNYSGGSVVVFPIQTDGRLGEATDIQQHTGSSVNPQRQEKPHPHSAVVSPDNRFLYVPDLGTDKIYIYEIVYEDKKLKPAAQSYADVKAGAGPRHFAFHPNGKFAYLAEELTSSAGAFFYDKTNGKLTPHESTTSLPTDFTENNSTADIHVEPAGNFLYISNRGHNSLAIYSIQKDGKLVAAGHQDVKGKTPRNFLIDPKGEYVFVANQDSNNITIFKLDKKSGKLTYTGNEIQVPAPVCLKIITLK